MPDEVKTADGPVPAISAEQIRATAREEIQQYIAAEKANAAPAVTEPAVVPVATENPLAAIVKQAIAPELAKLAIMANSASDAAMFYVEHPEALKYKKDIEAAFNQLVANGTPFNRNALYNHYKGEHEEERFKERLEAEKVKQEQLVQAETLGGGIRPVTGKVQQATELGQADLAKALENVTF